MAEQADNCGGIVLAGGWSRRMGRAKEWLPCGGEVMLQRVVRLVSEAVRPVVVAGRPGQSLPELPHDVRVVGDALRDFGPLAGMAAGMDALGGTCAAAFVTGGDHPFLRPAFVRRLVSRLDGHDAVMVSSGGSLRPLPGVYRLSLRETLATMLREGEHRVGQLAERCDAVVLSPADFADVDATLESLRNVNEIGDCDGRLSEPRPEGSG